MSDKQVPVLTNARAIERFLLANKEWLLENDDYLPAITFLREQALRIDQDKATVADKQQYQMAYRDLLNRRPDNNAKAPVTLSPLAAKIAAIRSQ